MLNSAVKIAVRSVFRVVALVTAFSVSTYRDLDIASLVSASRIVWWYALVFAVIGAVYDLSTRADRSHWRYASIQNVLANVRTSTFTLLIFLILTFVLDRAATLPRSTFILTWFFDIGFFSAALLVRRALHERAIAPALIPFLSRSASVQDELLLILGTLDSADAFLRDNARDRAGSYQPIGLITRDEGHVTREVRGIRVLASLEGAPSVLENFSEASGGKAILFVDDSIAPADFDAELLGRMRTAGVRMLRRPPTMDLHAGLSQEPLRELNLEELLSRPPVDLDFSEIQKMISGRRVLVTGAGGSIGSEISRQVAALGCSHLSLLDNSEFGLFRISMEVGDKFPTLSRKDILCDIRDAERTRSWFADEQPDIVFHSAALKHVPLMEEHPCESVLTNVTGTWNVADAARRSGMTNMVFISTDKAVDPSSVMGATKRLAESIVRRYRAETNAASFSVVRFGNVLGSAGSVVPTFLEQIRRGGPVTVTHPDIERYFMTIPEAVQLVLHATASSASRGSSESGLFVLDMGSPVKIVDLARRLIDLTGGRHVRNIDIQITGLRPGEKLTEELIDSTEDSRYCDQGVIEVSDRLETELLDLAAVQALHATAQTGNRDATRAQLFDLLDQVRKGADSARSIA